MTTTGTVNHPAPPIEIPPIELEPIEHVAPGAPEQAMPKGLATKLAKILGDIQPVPKAGYNEDQGYWYARSGDVSLAVRQAMAKHGVVLLWAPVGIQWRHYKTISNKDMREATMWYLATFFDCETGEQYAIRWPGIASDLQDKVLAKCATAAQKTFLVTQFQIPSDETDTDQQQPDRSRPAARQEREPQRTQDREKITGTITEFERKNNGAHVTVKDKRFWVGPILAKKFPADSKGKGCALLYIERENQHGKFFEVVSVLSLADKVMSASELLTPPATAEKEKAGPPKQQSLPTREPGDEDRDDF